MMCRDEFFSIEEVSEKTGTSSNEFGEAAKTLINHFYSKSLPLKKVILSNAA